MMSWFVAHALVGYWYQFWSGIAATFERAIELVVIGGLLWHRHNCHHKPCWRIGKHAVQSGGITTMYCTRHTEPMRRA